MKKGDFKITYIILHDDVENYVTEYCLKDVWYYYINGDAVSEEMAENKLDDARFTKGTTIIRTFKEL